MKSVLLLTVGSAVALVIVALFAVEVLQRRKARRRAGKRSKRVFDDLL